MSAPAPGPNGTMNFTVRVGQFCASAGAVRDAVSRARAATNSRVGSMAFPWTFDISFER
jgi:hypothetical protein